MQSFARVTKLTNISGRGDYISNPDRQEEIVVSSAPVDWEPYHRFEMENQKTATKNNEGREIIIALPNDWAKLPEKELASRVQSLAVTAVGKDTDMQWAVHWNKAHTNLHVHVIFSERQREKEPGRWDRDIYHTEDGKVARRKADRAKDAEGKELPPVHRKGDLKGEFTAKDTRYKEKGWVPAMKEQLRTEFRERWGVEIEKANPLHEYHEGKGKEAPVIRAKNEAIRATNRNIRALTEAHPELARGRTYNAIKREAVKEAKQGHVTHFEKSPDGLRVKVYTLETWRAMTGRKRPVSRVPEQLQTTSTPAQTVQSAPEPPKTAPKEPEQLVAPKTTEPAVPFADLLAAQKELYRQTFALHDKRKPLDTAELRRAADIRSAAHDLTSALDRKAAAWERERSCGFFQRKEKKAAQSDYRIATRQADKALAKLSELGVSTRIDGRAADSILTSREDFNALIDRVKATATDIEREAHRIARPENAPKGSQEAVRAAESRFKALCREIPPEQHKAARAALEDDLRGSEGKATGMAKVQADIAVRQARTKYLPGPEQERQREKVQERGRDR